MRPREIYRNFRRLFRHRALEPGRYLREAAARAFGRRRGLPPAPLTRVLLASDGGVMTSEEQFNPFYAYRHELKTDLHVVSTHLLLKDVLRAPRLVLPFFDVIVFKLPHFTPLHQALRAARILKDAAGGKPLIYFDGDDDLCVQWPETLPSLDLYVKKHLLRERGGYLSPLHGKSNLTDYVHRHYGYSFDQDPIAPATRPVAADQLAKIVPGTNVASDRKIMDLHREHPAPSDDSHKTVDVMFRGNVPQDWLQYLRKDIEPALARLEPDYRVIVPRERVPHDEYIREMTRSKICISPFGYGEICWRDFEAVICGCLLVKPDMGHVQTEPDIFVAHETYVPVRWDYADLEEQCRYYLGRPEERLRIARRALAVLDDFYGNRRSVGVLKGLLDAAARR